jgi:hypothetical protein
MPNTHIQAPDRDFPMPTKLRPAYIVVSISIMLTVILLSIPDKPNPSKYRGKCYDTIRGKEVVVKCW